VGAAKGRWPTQDLESKCVPAQHARSTQYHDLARAFGCPCRRRNDDEDSDDEDDDDDDEDYDDKYDEDDEHDDDDDDDED
jgi:hypothetical protein